MAYANRLCLRDFKKVNANLRMCRKNQAAAVHKIIFEKEGDRRNRLRLREFDGFTFNKNDNEYKLKDEYIKNNLCQAELISVCVLLGLNDGQDDVETHILDNLRAENLLKDTADESEDEEEYEGDQDVQNEDEDDSICGRTIVNTEVVDPDIHEDRTHSSNEIEHVAYDKPGGCRSTQRSSFSLSFRDVEDSIKPFNGKNGIAIKESVRKFEETAVMFNWSEMQTYVFARRSITGLAKQFLTGEKGLTTWPKLKGALLNEFKVRISNRQVHQILAEKTMQKGGDVMEYLYAMKNIVAEGEIAEKDIISYIIEGISDLNTNKQILYGSRNLEEFKEKIREYEQFINVEKPKIETKPTKCGKIKCITACILVFC